MSSGSKTEEEPLCGQFKLTKKQRLYGFVYCICIGFGLTVLVCAHAVRACAHFNDAQGIILLAIGSITGFAVCYSLGTITALTRLRMLD